MATHASLRFDSQHQVYLAFGDIFLLPGYAAHRIVLPVETMGRWLDPDSSDSNAPILLAGTVHTAHRWLADLQSVVAVVYGSSGGGKRLSFDLSDDQLIALERARDDGDIEFRLDLQGTLLQPPDDVHPVTDLQVTLRISRESWRQVLDQAGAEVGIVIRVPSPLADPFLQPANASGETVRSYSQATDRLRDARAELRDGNWEQCIAICRKVLENIAKLADLPPESSLKEVPPKHRTQDQRWAAIYYSVLSMTHAANHDDDGNIGTFTWSRADAEAILAATAGQLARCTAR